MEYPKDYQQYSRIHFRRTGHFDIPWGPESISASKRIVQMIADSLKKMCKATYKTEYPIDVVLSHIWKLLEEEVDVEKFQEISQ